MSQLPLPPFRVLCLLLGIFSVVGCTFPPTKPASVTRDRAFISYWPPPAGSAETRLAVKDLIAMKGEITTAGSKYLAHHGRPASKDAACLRNLRLLLSA